MINPFEKNLFGRDAEWNIERRVKAAWRKGASFGFGAGLLWLAVVTLLSLAIQSW